MKFRVIQGDIAQESADALVNAAGTSLRMGSGVAGALRRVGGEALGRAAVAAGPVELGAVAVTDAYDLDAEYVIHAAAMPHYGDGRATAESIRDAVRHALQRGDELGCESLVVPALGCGVAGFELAEGVEIIVAEIHAFDPDFLSDVRFIAYGDAAYRTVSAVGDDGRTRSTAAG